MTETPREQILTEAAGLITGDRNKTYGPPTENFANTAALWNVQIGHKLKTPLTAADVAQLMVQLKMARMIAQPKRDNYVDAAGYLACGWECEESAPSTAYRYFLDCDGWYWRWDVENSSLTYMTPSERIRKQSNNSVESLFHSLDPGGVSAADVPEWAR